MPYRLRRMVVFLGSSATLSLGAQIAPAAHGIDQKLSVVEFVVEPKGLLSDRESLMLKWDPDNGPTVTAEVRGTTTQALPSGSCELTVEYHDEVLLDLNLKLKPGEKRRIVLADELHPAFGRFECLPGPGSASVWSEAPLPPKRLFLPTGLSPYYHAADWSPETNYLAALSDTLPYPKGKQSLLPFDQLSNPEEPEFPVLLVNDSNYAMVLDPFAALLMEAKGPNGKWWIIEAGNPNSVCGVGVKPCVLAPHSAILLKAWNYKGVFKTKLRLVLFEADKPTMCSMEFDGSVNYGQLVREAPSSPN